MQFQNQLAGLVLSLVLFSLTPAFAYYPSAEKVMTKIAFGSCNVQRLSQSHWDVIGDQKPDLWIWLGDVIYADFLPPFLREHEYNHLKKDKYYKKFSSRIPVIGTWDDHDYGENNTDGDIFFKTENQKLFLNFMDEPKNSPRRTQDGIYTVYRFGPKGRQVRVIALDLRYFREEPGENAVMLGEAQWKWLSKQLLTEDSADITLVLSSSQFLAYDHPYEKWEDYPEERQRLLDLLAIAPGRYVFLSGDRHFAETSVLALHDGRHVYDLTSSGLTHTRTNHENKNRFRVGNFVDDKNFGVLNFNWNYNPVQVNYQIWGTDGQMREMFLLEE